MSRPLLPRYDERVTDESSLTLGQRQRRGLSVSPDRQTIIDKHHLFSRMIRASRFSALVTFAGIEAMMGGFPPT